MFLHKWSVRQCVAWPSFVMQIKLLFAHCVMMSDKEDVLFNVLAVHTRAGLIFVSPPKWCQSATPLPLIRSPSLPSFLILSWLYASYLASRRWHPSAKRLLLPLLLQQRVLVFPRVHSDKAPPMPAFLSPAVRTFFAAEPDVTMLLHFTTRTTARQQRRVGREKS